MVTELRQARRTLLDRVNQGIRNANIKRASFPGVWVLRPTLNRKQLNLAVCMARRPGPYMDYKAGDLNQLLINAGFRP